MIPRLRSDLVVREIDGDLVVYDPIFDRTAVFNADAAQMLEWLRAAKSLAGVVELLVERTGADPEAADSAIRNFLEGLAGQRLLAEREDTRI